MFRADATWQIEPWVDQKDAKQQLLVTADYIEAVKKILTEYFAQRAPIIFEYTCGEKVASLSLSSESFARLERHRFGVAACDGRWIRQDRGQPTAVQDERPWSLLT